MTEKLRGANRPTILRRLLPIAAVLLLAAVLVVPVAAGYADATSVSTEEDLKNYLENGNSVKLQNDIDITSEIKITSTVTIYGDGHTLYKGKDNISLFNVTSGTLTLGDGTNLLTIHGNDTYYNSSNINLWALIKVSGSSAKLVMNNGVTLTNSSISQDGIGNTKEENGDGVTGWNGAAVSVNNGATFEMNGGKITNNTARRAAVYINSTGSTFTMNGGEITNNTALRYGGGVLINAGGSFTMSGNSILKDNSGACGGGIYVGKSMFTMAGGSIIENRATSSSTSDGQGGGVMLDGSTFIMNGGSITGNTAITGDKNGGGVYISKTTFTMNRGSIAGNTATDYGGGVYVGTESTFTMNGDSITGNTANQGGGVYVYDTTGKATITLAGGSITGNTATNGGAVYTSQAILFTMSKSATIDANNEIYFHSPGTYINITGDSFTGEAKNITGDGNVITDNYNIIRISADSPISAYGIWDKFALNSVHSSFYLVPSSDDRNITITTTKPPMVNSSSVQLTAWNSSIVNISFTTLPSWGDTVKVKVNLTNTTNPADVFSAELTENIAAGHGSTNDIQITGLTAGSIYKLNITLFATGDKASPTYEHAGNYPAPAYLTISTTPSLSSVVGSAYTVTLETVGTGTQFTWSNTTTLPEWLMLSTAGVLSGTPTKVETQTIKIKVVSDRGEEVEKEFTLTISPVPPTPSSSGSSSQGSSVWLMETQTPTPTPTVTPTETEPVPTDIPVTQPTEAESPAPLLAVLAGLGAVAVLRRK